MTAVAWQAAATAGISGLLLVLVFTGMIYSTWGAFHATAYRSLIGQVNESEFSKDLAPIDPAAVRLVDQKLAEKLAETELGKYSALGSRVDIGTFNIQLVDGKLYWVAPLEWSSLFKWAFGDIGTPGYMKVSATNQHDIQLVKTVGGKNIRLRYLMSGGYFGDYLPRYLYTHGYASQGFGDYTFEIDDSGNPYWVVTKLDHKIGIDGTVAAGVIVVDAQTGEISDYGIKDAPKWIDRIQPENVITDRLTDWGEFVHGWWNPSGLDKMKTTPGMSLVYGNDGRAYWYTGMQTVGADQGTLGFMLINTRTGEARLYKQNGITELACQNNIRGLVDNHAGWWPNNCILYNVSGVPTYIAIIKDSGGNPKAVAVASVTNRDIVVSHSEILGALREYRAMLRSRGGTANVDKTKVVHFTVNSQVERISHEIIDGNTIYYIMLTGQTRIFSASAGISPKIALTQKGDTVLLEGDDTGSNVVDISSFDNLSIELTGSK